MRRILYLILALSLGVLAASDNAFAESSERTIGSVAQFASANWGAFPVIYVSAYSAGGSLGGGKFLHQSCTPNLGNCFADNAGHTFQRANPAWDGSEWGLIGDHVTDNSTTINAMLVAAKAAGVLTATISQNGQYYFSTGI